MKLKFIFVTLLFVLSACASGMSGSSEKGNTSNNHKTPESFLNSFSRASCERIFTCGTQSNLVATMMSQARLADVGDCVDMGQSRVAASIKEWNAAVNKGTAIYNSEYSQTCLAAISKAPCDDIAFTSPDALNKLEGCKGLIQGTIELTDFDKEDYDTGEKCESNIECKGADSYCDWHYCKQPLLYCGQDKLCNTTSEFCDINSNTCIAYKEINQTCNHFSECLSKNCESGTCQKPRPIQPPFPLDGKCNNSDASCSIGQYCGASNQCVNYKQEGDKCKVVNYEDPCGYPYNCMQGKCGKN